MRVLMLGWEFPPHISGGLGTACFGLTKALDELGDPRAIEPLTEALEDRSSVIRRASADALRKLNALLK